MDTKNKSARQLKLEAELRENLRRRKEQARARRERAPEGEADGPEPPGDEGGEAPPTKVEGL